VNLHLRSMLSRCRQLICNVPFYSKSTINTFNQGRQPLRFSQGGLKPALQLYFQTCRLRSRTIDPQSTVSRLGDKISQQSKFCTEMELPGPFSSPKPDSPFPVPPSEPKPSIEESKPARVHHTHFLKLHLVQSLIRWTQILGRTPL
jgi:hypothetical protein